MRAGRNRVKFVAERVNKFCCPPDRVDALLWDADEKSLCIRARKGGSRAYYFQSRYNGKVVKIKIGNLSDKAVTINFARKKARKYQSQIDEGFDPRQVIARRVKEAKVAREKSNLAAVKFGTLWDEYVDANKVHWSDSYAHDHEKAMRAGGRKRKRSSRLTVPGVLFSLRNIKISDLDSELVIEWARTEVVHRPTVTANGYRIFRAALNWAAGTRKYKSTVRPDEIFKNRELRRLIHKPKPRRDVLLQQHLPTWFRSVRESCDPIVACYLQGLLITGARREEMAQLKWDDVDLEWDSLEIRDKVDGSRQIPLTPYFKFLLSELPRYNEWVFYSHSSRSGRIVDPYRAHKRALDDTNLPHITLHGLRRSFGTLSEWVECPVGVVAQIQGHKPSAIAEKHYRVRPLDLLSVWHRKIEEKILEFAKIDFPST
ncbi:MAG: integrase family protein [Pseudomonadota bacterium]